MLRSRGSRGITRLFGYSLPGRPISNRRHHQQTQLTCCLVHLFLLIETDLARSSVDEKEETTDNGEDLEKVVLGKVLVGVSVVEL